MPFTQEEFMQVFARYNLAIWPLQVLIYLPAAAVLFLIPRKTKLSDGFVSATLAVLWILAGAVYHIGFFSAINPGARVFGGLFILQGLFLLVGGVISRRIRFEYKPGLSMWMGWIIAVYAMVGYPVLGSLIGHRYPEAPMFGVAPCPITIFTFGVLLWATRGLPRYLLVIPAIWSLIALAAATKFGIYQDYGLLVSMLIALPIIIRQARPTKSAS